MPFSAGEIDTFDAFVSALSGALTGWSADKFDYLVNNAATPAAWDFLTPRKREFDALYRIHVKSVFSSAKNRCWPMAGRIVNVSSGHTAS